MINTNAKCLKILKSRMCNRLCNKSGFISVLALGIVINVAILAVGITADTSKIRENNKQAMEQMPYEQRVDLQRMADEVWVKYNNFETTTPYKYLKKGYTVKFPERNMYGKIVGSEDQSANNQYDPTSKEALAKFRESLEQE